MPVPSITTISALISDLTTSSGTHELIFVNGKPYEGEVSFGRYKGFGWESGRTATIYLSQAVDPSSKVFLVDLDFIRLRECFLTENKSRHWAQEWEAIDLPEDQKSSG